MHPSCEVGIVFNTYGYGEGIPLWGGVPSLSRVSFSIPMVVVVVPIVVFV